MNNRSDRYFPEESTRGTPDDPWTEQDWAEVQCLAERCGGETMHRYEVHLADGEYTHIRASLPPGCDDGRVARIIAATYPDAVEFQSGSHWLPV